MAFDMDARWTDGKRTVAGNWRYVWHGDFFLIQLDGEDEFGVRRQPFKVHRDQPEWGEWRLVRS